MEAVYFSFEKQQQTTAYSYFSTLQYCYYYYYLQSCHLNYYFYPKHFPNYDFFKSYDYQIITHLCVNLNHVYYNHYNCNWVYVAHQNFWSESFKFNYAYLSLDFHSSYRLKLKKNYFNYYNYYLYANIYSSLFSFYHRCNYYCCCCCCYYCLLYF